MKTYLVGGAVRDRLLGLPPGDRDWVVVGATQAGMEARGFKAVGRDFPVFLHPDTGEEYALARTERKSGRGYRGFVVDADPSVTLEEDLQRRDFTINAIAQADDGTLVDPYGGARDIQARVLRHVGPAFVEDPLRVLRAARFMARFAPLGFTLAPETVGQALATVPGVASVHDLHIWSVGPERIMLTAHLVVRDVRQWEAVLEGCHALLVERFAIQHATLQPEPMTRTVRWLAAPAHSRAPKTSH